MKATFPLRLAIVASTFPILGRAGPWTALGQQALADAIVGI